MQQLSPVRNALDAAAPIPIKKGIFGIAMNAKKNGDFAWQKSEIRAAI